MHRILIIGLLLLSCGSHQNNTDSTVENEAPKPVTKPGPASSFIATMDSVILISHESYDRSPPDIKTGKLPPGANLLDSGRLNTSIVKERIRLGNKDAADLGRILDEKVTGDITYTACFDPHHTILAYKGNKVFYIDICFDCLGFDILDFPFEESMSYAKYDKLRAFFKRHGFD
jgi:hypothetical protein